jgi:hypothetical protein
LDAARSLFSYRSEQPPARQADGEYTGERMPDGRRPVGLGDVLTFGFTVAPEATEQMIVEARAQVRGTAVSLESRSG